MNYHISDVFVSVRNFMLLIMTKFREITKEEKYGFFCRCRLHLGLLQPSCLDYSRYTACRDLVYSGLATSYTCL
jgi:hypothetical protein